MSGASGRLWLTNDGRGRLELQSDAGDAQIVWDKTKVTVFDASSNTVYRFALPAKTDTTDTAKGAPHATDESKVPAATFQEVGSGSLDFPAILKAADAAGVEHYFVEQDHTPGDPIASLRKSYDYLQTIA